MARQPFFLIFGALLLQGLCACATTEAGRTRRGKPVVVSLPSEPGWRDVVTPQDITRIEGLDALWQAVLVAPRQSSGGRRRLEAEGPLLDPQAALPLPAPTPGVYRCRTLRLGAGEGVARPTRRRSRQAADAGLKVYAPFDCFVANEGAQLAFTKAGGSERPAGWFWPDIAPRLVFVGTTPAGPDGPTLPYGEPGATNTVGVVERVGSFRWRIVIPDADNAHRLTVIEFVPHPTAIHRLETR